MQEEINQSEGTKPRTGRARWLIAALIPLALVAVGLLLGLLQTGSEASEGDAAAAAAAAEPKTPPPAGPSDASDPGGRDPAAAEVAPPESKDDTGAVVEPDAPEGGACGADPPCAEVDVYVLFDWFATQTSYEIVKLDAAGDGDGATPIASHAGDDLKATHEKSLCLEDGSYEFTIFDAEGDGMCCGHWLGDGYYEVSSYGEVLAEGAEFGSSEATPFDVDADADGRRDVARSIVLGMTSPDVLADESSPQSRALGWISCRDRISARLFRGRDPSTGLLPQQARGTREGGDSGEEWVRRRYALAVFYFAALDVKGLWGDGDGDGWSFLSESEHECSWHRAAEAGGDGLDLGGEAEPAGLVCRHPETFEIVLDDEKTEIGDMALIFDVPENFSLPPELDRIEGLVVGNYVVPVKADEIDESGRDETSASVALGCPATLSHSKELDDATTMHYAIVPPSGPDSNDGVLCARIEVSQEFPTWIGFAASSDAFMAGSQAVIGTFGGDGDARGTVAKYRLEGYDAPSLADASMQTLVGGSIEHDDEAGVTTLSFARLLVEGGDEIAIAESGANNFLYARGRETPGLRYHGVNKGSFTLDFEGGV
ncbi:hypothetical protein ACHAWF_008538 [Thalassiosira exigua]